MKRVHHVAIVVRDLDRAVAFYRDGFGLTVDRVARPVDQGVRAALLNLENAAIEIIQPLALDSGVGRFLERRGEGLHHLCFTSPDLAAELNSLKSRGVELIDAEPRPGLAGLVCFLHPRAHAGVLVELVEVPE